MAYTTLWMWTDPNEPFERLRAQPTLQNKIVSLREKSRCNPNFVKF